MVKETYKLIKSVKKMYPVVQFFKDRYFPDGTVYYSHKALIETKSKGRKVAPFVIPVVNGISMVDEGYRAYEVDAPFIAPKMPITAEELEKKAFGESPESGRTPADRENEIEAEHLDDLRKSIFRRHEQMCTELITTGKISMKHYANAEDAVKGINYQMKELRFFDSRFDNIFFLTKAWESMTTEERIQMFYRMASVLRKRGVRATDIVLSADVSMELMTDKDFMEFYNSRRVEFGQIDQKELPEGVTANGTVNVNGVIFTLFTYDEYYEDLNGNVTAFLPAGTIAMLPPSVGETAYAQVTFVRGDKFETYAEKVVPRVVASEANNMIEIQTFSRPVPYPHDWESWLVANTSNTVLLSETAINNLSQKSDVIDYAASIGLTLSSSESLADLKSAVIAYQKTLPQ